MREHTFGRKKANSSDVSHPSLVSPSTPTLANPVRGFGLPTNNQLSSQQQELQSADELSLKQQLIQEKPRGQDISRISFVRPQAKLTVGEPGDKYEQEADIMARRVMAMSAPTVQRQILPSVQTIPPVSAITPLAQREAISQEEEIQTKPALQRANNGRLETTDSLESRLNSSKGGGSPLADEVRSFMEPRFGADFSQVRVHTDSTAVQMNQELGAQAFTHGSDVYYGAGKTPGNNELTAHELTHVVQQGNSKSVQLQAESNTAQTNNEHQMLDQAINIVQQSLNAINSQNPKVSSGNQTEASPEEQAQKDGMQKVLQTLMALKSSNNIDEIRVATQPILAAARGNFAAVKLTSEEQAHETQSSYKSIPSIQSLPLVPALAGVGAGVGTGAGAGVIAVLSGPVGWAILGMVAVVGGYVGYQAYQDSRSRTQERTRVEPRVIPREREETQNTMRFQVQWGTNQGGPTFSQIATAPSSIGVTTVQAVAALEAAVSSVTPTKAKEAAEPAKVKQIQWILSRPPAGIATAGYSKSEYFPYKKYTDARVDVENLRGHNLRT